MNIRFTPQRSDSELTISRSGDVLTVNGVAYDFSLLTEGGLLPRSAVNCPVLMSDVERIDGMITLTLLLPHDQNASEARRFPAPIINPPNGEVTLPS